MNQIFKDSYKRKKYYILSLICMLTILIATILNTENRRVYKVYIDNRLVGITTEEPEVIRKTYNEVKAKRYAQGSEKINEKITIHEEVVEDNIQIVEQEELANRLYAELDEEEPVAAMNITSTNTYEKKIPFEVVYVEDKDLYIGETELLTKGHAGVEKVTVVSTIGEDGVVEEKIQDSQVIKSKQNKVIAKGVKEKPEYIIPVEKYTITSSFGPRWGRNHNGIDLAVKTGTEVGAAADGVVIQSGWNGGYGISIYVDHGNGVVTRYGHLSQAYAQVGKNVQQGEVLGLSGNTGNSTGPHLHFEIRIGGEAMNPVNYLDIEY